MAWWLDEAGPDTLESESRGAHRLQTCPGTLVEHQVGDDASRQGRQQHPVPIVAHGVVDVRLPARRADNRQLVLRGRPQPDTHAFENSAIERRYQLRSRGGESANAAHGGL